MKPWTNQPRMTDHQKLLFIKLLHTIIWLFFNLILVYLFYAAITNSVDHRFWIGVGIIAVECLLLMALHWTCPLTFLARRYSDSERANFDIILPNWLAKHNKVIYSCICAVLVAIYFISVK